MQKLEIDYEYLADKITERISAPPPEAVVWDKQQCADYFKCHPNHFMQHIASKGSFPKEFNLSGKCAGKKLWLAKEVMDWLKGIDR